MTDTYTIRFPYNHPDETVRWNGELKFFSELPAGALFVMVTCPGRVHEKLGDSDCACLVPWEYTCGLVTDDPLCEVLEKVTS